MRASVRGPSSPSPLPTRCPLAWVLALCMLVAGSGVVGAAKKRRPAVGAGQLLESGLLALRARDFAAADKALTEAYHRQPGPDGLCALGALAAAQQQVIAAQDLYRRCLAEDSAGPPATVAREKEARPVLDLPSPPAGEAAIRGDRGAWVMVDERLVGQLPLSMPLLLAAGRHTVTVMKGRASMSGPVNIQPGRIVELPFSREGSAMLIRMVPAVLYLSDYSGMAPADQTRLSQSVTRVLELEHRAQFPVDVALALAPALADCRKPAQCAGESAAALGIEHILVARIVAPAAAAGADWQLELTLLDTGIGAVAAAAQRSCPQCSGELAAGQISTMLGALLQQGIGRPRGGLAVTSTPAGAELVVDDRAVGQTPYRHPAWAGSHTLLVRQPGYESARLAAVVAQGQTATVTATLVPVAPPEVPAPPPVVLIEAPAVRPVREPVRLVRPRWRLVVGSVALVAGGLSVAAGAATLAPGAPCSAPTPTGPCFDYLNTQQLGAGLAGAGTLFTLAGVTLLALPGSMQR